MPSAESFSRSIARAAQLLAEADALIITAGAGMGVDSGLPDFRGEAGLWRAYPALGRARLRFEEIADPRRFVDKPRLAWGFYGHRLNLYRATAPHDGFRILREMAARLPHGAFVFTSNVDGHFQRAGFGEESVVECHGSIHWLQCLRPCDDAIWPATAFQPEINEDRCELLSAPPLCPRCHELARPNILMFGDWNWNDRRQREQMARFNAWRAGKRRLVVLEIGTGRAIPTVRRFGEAQDCPLIRINPRDGEVERGEDVSLPMNGLEGIRAIAAAGW
ncbi:MAG: NAD-dependent deacetylase [Azoarcus sp.]|jgi:NAD-dependent SIR2 family protein deacetylase|nr:NAD-dependent deacetylase [Azoarcus sp.]